jgi:ATP-dependent Lon protease
VVEGLARFRLTDLLSSDPFWRIEASPAQETGNDAPETGLLAESVRERIKTLGLSTSDELQEMLTAVSAQGDAGLLADVIAAALGLPALKEAEVLMALDVRERLRLINRFVSEAQALSEMKQRIHQEVHREVSKSQREAMLRHQLKAIKRELGEDQGLGDELQELAQRLDEADLPEEARKVASRELTRLERLGPSQAEHHVVRSYLELLADLPWNTRAEVSDDIPQVEARLDQDHYGLDEVKKRILEHLAVGKVTGDHRGTILCLVGPPGVGKTSLGESVAKATGRPFVRAALGGLRDEAEIRGHRRTYVGALPGRIINALRSAGAKNPLVLLDEVDKLSHGWAGWPEAALLEVLDPEQNRTFTDHYLELPFDLSEVLFVCTANTLEGLSAPLRDRLEVVEIDGYALEEKVQIALSHIVPRKLEEHGLDPQQITLSDEALNTLITRYTREAGVRQLSREITRICRAVTLETARQQTDDSKPQAVCIDAEQVRRHLGKERFHNDVAERTAIPGVATGLAWTPVGGDIIFVETSRMPGKGRLEITGQLGDVMKESARAALSYIRSHAEILGVDADFLESQDLHIHVPAGAVPKDGPSAGVTIFTALASLLSGRRVRADTAMTGECTLRGRVLQVGGVKAKVLAAHRAGIQRVILPANNRRDVEEVPDKALQHIELIFAEDMREVIEAAIEPCDTPCAGVPMAPPSDPQAANLS